MPEVVIHITTPAIEKQEKGTSTIPLRKFQDLSDAHLARLLKKTGFEYPDAVKKILISRYQRQITKMAGETAKRFHQAKKEIFRSAGMAAAQHFLDSRNLPTTAHKNCLQAPILRAAETAMMETVFEKYPVNAKDSDLVTILLYSRNHSLKKTTRNFLVKRYLSEIEHIAKTEYCKNQYYDQHTLTNAGVLHVIDFLDRRLASQCCRNGSLEAYILMNARSGIRDVIRAARSYMKRNELTHDIPALESEDHGRVRSVRTSLKEFQRFDPACIIERADLTRAFLSSVTNQERAVLIGYYVEGKKMKVIAKEMGLSVPRTSALHSSAKSRLFKRFGKNKEVLLQ